MEKNQLSAIENSNFNKGKSHYKLENIGRAIVKKNKFAYLSAAKENVNIG